MEFSTTPPWWMTDTYDIDTPFLHGAAVAVEVFGDGKTQPGWGLYGKPDEDGNPTPGFMERVKRGEFNFRTAAWRYTKHQKPFAYVMRSVPLVCIDIDGKNGGFSSVAQLGELPPTLAETSKSGNGYHLFYSTDEPWDTELGFAKFDDQIGIAAGIDIRATGCVYHYPTQRWNHREIVPMPAFLDRLLSEKRNRRVAATLAAKQITEMDEVDKMMAQHELTAELAKPIPAGKRNNTLFAIGSKMMAAQVEDWETMVLDRAIAVGLDRSEADKLVGNIAAYGS